MIRMEDRRFSLAGMNDIVTGTILVIAMNLVAVSVFEVRREDLQEVEYFDNGLIGERSWNALIAVSEHIVSS